MKTILEFLTKLKIVSSNNKYEFNHNEVDKMWDVALTHLGCEVASANHGYGLNDKITWKNLSFDEKCNYLNIVYNILDITNSTDAKIKTVFIENRYPKMENYIQIRFCIDEYFNRPIVVMYIDVTSGDNECYPVKLNNANHPAHPKYNLTCQEIGDMILQNI